jgi:hypothetical protein
VRKLLVIAVLAITSASANSQSNDAKHPTIVHFNRAWTEHNLINIDIHGEDGTVYKLTCNKDQIMCRIPKKTVKYALWNEETVIDAYHKVYECQNVMLTSWSAGAKDDMFVGVYCLAGVE